VASPDRPIRVLLFAPEPSLGGGVAAFDELFRSRLSATVQVEQFLAGRRRGILGRLLRALMPFYDATRLAGRLITRRYDVYHLNPSLNSRAALRDGLFLIVLGFFRRRQVLVFMRGWDVQLYQRIARSATLRFLFKAVYGRAARILILASPFAEDLAMLGIKRDRIHTFSTMFDGELIRGATRMRDDDQILVVFLARFIATKGIYELLEAFRHLSQRSARISLVMAGDGPELDGVRAWCIRHNLQHRIDLPGYVGGPEKAQLLANADIFVLPTYHGEGCPNALLEALGAGLPVIVTSVGGIADIVQHGVNGLIVPPGDSKAIAESIELLADDAGLRRDIGDRNRDVAWQKYEARRVTQRLESHYRALLEQTNSTN
jgi:glycosyltransferase involved in cell wall biosynthesis